MCINSLCLPLYLVSSLLSPSPSLSLPLSFHPYPLPPSLTPFLPPPSLPPSPQPENLLLASKAKGASVKLADFGLAVEALDCKHYYGQFLLHFRACVRKELLSVACIEGCQRRLDMRRLRSCTIQLTVSDLLWRVAILCHVSVCLSVCTATHNERH